MIVLVFPKKNSSSIILQALRGLFFYPVDRVGETPDYLKHSLLEGENPCLIDFALDWVFEDFFFI